MPLDPSQIEYVINEQHVKQPFSGVIQVREEGEVVFEDAYGYANRADAIPNVVNTRFGIASGTKTFTGVAVCQLIEQGKLALDTRFTDLVTAYEFPQFDPAITIRHLLTHSSGAPDYFDEEELDAQADFGAIFGDLPVYKVSEPKDLLPLFQNEPMKFAPGERFSYSNGGYILLGLAIEAASGMPYAEYVEQHVFRRAGMSDSGYFALNNLPARCATGYLDDGRTNIYEIPIKGMPDGGAFVTARDMARFWDALFEAQLLSLEMAAQLLRPQIEVNPANADDNRHYGYGVWVIKDEDGVSHIYSTGSDPGVAFVSTNFMAHKVDLTILGNTESAAWPVFGAVEELILGGNSANS
ncbi:MAG: beta-lactamase family protein [Anaerolineae bacterium]|nr:beta-lactamase family protein [Anaerolineae bacterium]